MLVLSFAAEQRYIHAITVIDRTDQWLVRTYCGSRVVRAVCVAQTDRSGQHLDCRVQLPTQRVPMFVQCL